MGNSEGIWYRKMSISDYNLLSQYIQDAVTNYGLDTSVINLLNDFDLSAGSNGYVYAPWDSISDEEWEWITNDLIDLYDFELEIGAELFAFSNQPVHAF